MGARDRKELAAFLLGLRWDGEPRVERFLETYAGAEPGAEARAASRRLLVDLVRRALEPGCQVDASVVLVGPQGSGKTSLLNALAGDGLLTQLVAGDLGRDAMAQVTGGAWLVELVEIESALRSARRRDELKAFLSSRVDTYRPPFAKLADAFPRACVFVGTTGDADAFLDDPTGSRRFWPVRVGRANPEAVARDREQVLAEAVAIAARERPRAAVVYGKRPGDQDVDSIRRRLGLKRVVVEPTDAVGDGELTFVDALPPGFDPGPGVRVMSVEEAMVEPVWWLDLESTGLDPARDQILEVAVRLSPDLRSCVLDEDAPAVVYHRVLALTDAARARLALPENAAALEMHTKSGLLAECEASSVTVEQVEAELASLVEGSWQTLAGSSVHFDLGFLRAHAPSAARRFSHRLLDVSAVKVFCRALGMDRVPRAEAHRAEADALESWQHAAHCARWLDERYGGDVTMMRLASAGEELAGALRGMARAGAEQTAAFERQEGLAEAASEAQRRASEAEHKLAESEARAAAAEARAAAAEARAAAAVRKSSPADGALGRLLAAANGEPYVKHGVTVYRGEAGIEAHVSIGRLDVKADGADLDGTLRALEGAAAAGLEARQAEDRRRASELGRGGKP